ncbi:heme-binding protein 2 [Melanotaenia boesemani]|uniref:heme-binding protein 2 n=1 Tax=Melanotaenia boesemani TaxID=1250792 RepID=UPI001C0552C2|nr:heme-binding protein 2 [Melanotaenia boesemani]
MICLTGLVGFLLVLTAEARVGNSSEVDFCTETEQCLLFDLVCKADKYEVRHYDSVKWVATDVTSYAMELAAPVAFTRLFKYITGENEDGKKIQMTSPVVLKLPDKRFWEKGVFTMHFLLPAEYQMNPPSPTNKDVYIHETPEMNVYVLSFGGWLSSLSNNKKSVELSTVLDSVNAKYNKGHLCVAGYNSPMTMFNRHNEVWYVVEGDPVCPSS